MTSPGFIVVGVNRSGTSAVAAALRALGVYFGAPEDMLSTAIDIDYDSGENRHLVEIGALILRALERDGQPARGMPDNWSEIAEVSDRVPEVARFIELYFGGRQAWGWKDPRTSLIIPFFERVFESIGGRPTYLMPVRHPLEVAEGLQRRQGLSLREGMGYWVHYTLTALSALDAERVVLIPYGDFVADPRRILEPLWDAHRLERPAEADWKRVREVVQPGLYRTRASDDVLPAFVSDVWAQVGLLAAGLNWGRGSEGRRRLEGLAAEWRDWSALTSLASKPIGEVRWKIGDRTGSLPFRGDGEWHSCVVQLSSGDRGTVDLWFLPRFRTVRVRNIEFEPKNPSQQNKATAGGSAFADFTECGDLKLHIFGPTAHLSVEIPRGSVARELRFAFQVSTGKQAVTEVAQRLASAYSRLCFGAGAPPQSSRTS